MNLAEATVNIADVVGRGYKAFWNTRARYRVLKGGKASKKSTTTALWFIFHLMKYPQANLVVIRNVLNTHRDSTMAQLKWATRRLQVDHLWKFTEAPLEGRYLPTGQKILFRGFDDPDKLASTTVDQGVLCWAWLEEAFEITSEDGFNKMDLSFPRGEVPDGYFKQTTITFNPWSEKHWLKRRFFDTTGDDIWSGTTNYLCNEFLDETDRAMYERMKYENPRRYAVAGLGEWGISEGLIYENWVVQNFNVFELPDQWKYKHVFGLDYGYTNDPTAFVAMAVNPLDKEIYVYKEHYEKKMLNHDIATMIIKNGFAKERIRADCAEPKTNDDLRRMGISRITPARKGKDSVVNGISRLQEYRIIVHPECTHMVEELSAYCWDKKSGTEDGINRPVDRDNHLMDAMRYAMEDVLYFRPQKDVPRGWQKDDYGGYAYVGNTGGSIITGNDLARGWGY